MYQGLETFYEKDRVLILVYVQTYYSNSKAAVVSSQDSQWIILFKCDGVLFS